MSFEGKCGEEFKANNYKTLSMGMELVLRLLSIIKELEEEIQRLKEIFQGQS